MALFYFELSMKKNYFVFQVAQLCGNHLKTADFAFIYDLKYKGSLCRSEFF